MAERAPRLSFACPPAMLDRLVARYGEPHRRYHVWSHVLACFEAKEALTSAASPAVDLALLFHDAIYDPLAHDNEPRSAELLMNEGRGARLDDGVLERAKELVLATMHQSPSALSTNEARVVVDADLSILGSDPETFAEYERQVREEYAVVPDALFTAGRRRFLESFLARPQLFSTARGRELWETRARKNLERSLARLV